MIRALALILALLIAPAHALGAPLPGVDRTSLGPIIITMDDKYVTLECLRWRADILVFMATALGNAGFKTARKPPKANHAHLRIKVIAAHYPSTDTCKGHFSANLTRAIWLQEGLEVDAPVLLDPGDGLGPAKSIDTDLVNDLRIMINQLKDLIPE